jgi:hypothetical protein
MWGSRYDVGYFFDQSFSELKEFPAMAVRTKPGPWLLLE